MFPALQMGLPGGPELLIIFIIMLFIFGVPLALVVGGVALYRRGSGSEDRVERLEARIDELERELERERHSGDGDND